MTRQLMAKESGTSPEAERLRRAHLGVREYEGGALGPLHAPLGQQTEVVFEGVGSRGHGGFAGLPLGSVSHQCAQHAPCPVVIVRTTSAANALKEQPWTSA
jgi:universal stress protein family protein